MKAPDKIYVHVKGDKTLNTWNNEWIGVHDIEYTRTDIFIEKALKFLDENFYFNNGHCSIESGVFNSKEEMFEDFKKYMEYE